MPELPEVEVTRLGLAQALAGARVSEVRLGKPLRWPLGVEPASLRGQVAGLMQRRGKYLWLPLQAEAVEAVTRAASGGGLLLHLGMSGSLRLDAGLGPPGPHDHFDLVTSQGTLRLTDPRRFGAVVWSASLQAQPAHGLLAGLGMEPFDPAFDGLVLWRQWRRRGVAVKQALLAGDTVVGAGNIYASEALHRAGIDPRTPAGKLSRARCQRLAEAVRQTLAEAITRGGSTLRDFRDAQGHAGSFQDQAKVYDREGQPCASCGAPVRRIVQGQRATYFCARCQRR
jgi:formamidopyrimidine-DNA glycosylase